MNLSGISSRSIFSALQRAMTMQKRDLAAASQEVQTGSSADPVALLGKLGTKRVTLMHDSARLDSILQTNKLAINRLSASQSAIDGIRGSAQMVLESLSAVNASGFSRSSAASASSSTASAIAAMLNTSLAGQFIFSGLNTDVPAISVSGDYPGHAEMSAAFFDHFGLAETDPAAAAISPADFMAFIASDIEPLFIGVGWNSQLSQSTNATITSRISLNQSLATSVSANETAIRRTVMAAAVSAQFINSGVNGAVAESIGRYSVEQSTRGIGELAELQGRLGYLQERVEAADEMVSSQRNLFESLAADMVSVDPYEAATRLNNITSQLDVTYMLSQKIMNLSIMKYLD